MRQPSAITTKKLERGLSLVVLGVKLSLSAFGCACRPAEAKTRKCIDAICKALKEEMLHPGAAQKLARRLSWAAQFMFFMLGRAMLRPISRQQCEVWLHQRCLEGGFAMVVLGIEHTMLWKSTHGRTRRDSQFIFC